MTTVDRPYHHGDLRSALLAAAEMELAERGIEAFSLRSVAKRAGVSHAAPAHHFGDANGLLTALAVEGHRQFLACQRRREVAAAADPAAQLVAAGLGYVDFAHERPTLFRLIFASARPKMDDPDLMAAGGASYQHLVDQVTAIGGGPEDLVAAWAMAHGLADLTMSGRFKMISTMDRAAQDAMIARLIRRVTPEGI